MSQPQSLLRINALCKCDAAFQMRAKVREIFAVLAVWTEPDAIRQRRLKLIEVAAHDIWVLIYYQPRQVLPHSAAHDSRLAVICGESFFQQDSRDVPTKSFRT